MSLPTPPPGWLLGLDVSQFQGPVPFPSLTPAGVSFAYARATDGEHTVDQRWPANVRGLLDAGLPTGAYGVLEPYGLARAAGQARRFCELVADAGTTLPPVLDFELAAHLSGLDALRSALAWCEEVEARMGRRVMVYTGPAFFSLLVRYAGAAGSEAATALGTRPLWVAHFTGGVGHLPAVPAPWAPGGWTLWQESGGRKASRDAASMPGTGVEVDCDFYRGTVEALRRVGCPLDNGGT